MAKRLLSICIPTYNRKRFLKETLESIFSQIKKDNLEKYIQLVVSDDGSTDGTSSMLKEMQKNVPYLEVETLPINQGFNTNFLNCYTNSNGKFCWILGDDEQLIDGGIKKLILLLKNKSKNIGLVICFEKNYNPRIAVPAEFSLYVDYANYCSWTNPQILLEHTLVSHNIFLRSTFHSSMFAAKHGSDYSHMYGMVSGVINKKRGVYISNFPLFSIRQNDRPPFAHYPQSIDKSWYEYLEWQKDILALEFLVIQDAFNEVRRLTREKIKNNPWAYFRCNSKKLLTIEGWRFAIRRIKFHFYENKI